MMGAVAEVTIFSGMIGFVLFCSKFFLYKLICDI